MPRVSFYGCGISLAFIYGRPGGAGWECLIVKGGLSSAFIMIKCTKDTHDDCRGIRDALVDASSGCVQEAYTTDATVDGTTWCVAASAIVPTDKAAEFKEKVNGIETNDAGVPVKVKNLMFLLDKK